MMAAERTIIDVAGLFRRWAEQPPAAVLDDSRSVKTIAGERHGSWFVRLSWEAGELVRSVEVAISNATSLPDQVASEAFVSVRASASTEAAWVATNVYERRRSLARVSDDDLVAWVATAASVAASYTPGSLAVPYPLNSVTQPGAAGDGGPSDVDR